MNDNEDFDYVIIEKRRIPILLNLLEREEKRIKRNKYIAKIIIKRWVLILNIILSLAAYFLNNENIKNFVKLINEITHGK